MRGVISATAFLARLCLLAALIASALLPDRGWARDTTGTTIQAIQVSGAERVARESVLSRLTLKPGERYDAAKANASIKALFATGQYKDVKITAAGSTLTVTLVENPAVSDVTISGNSALKQDELLKAIKLKKGEIYTEAKAHTDVLALRERYREEGRLTTTIEAKTAGASGNRVALTFEVHEGDVNRVSSIAFEGNHAYSASELESVIHTARSSWLDILKTDSIYVAARLDEDRDLLKRHYLTHGYADVKITAAEGKAAADGKGYEVKFVIEEGEKFAFADISIDAKVAGLDTGSLKDKVLVRTGDPYNARDLDQSVEALSLALWDASQRFARVSSKLTRNAAARTIAVAFHIEDGPHITVERIDIKGNTKTRDHVIRRQMKLAEGEPFNSLILERDKARIKALGFFKSVEVKAKPGSGKEKVVVAVELEEDETITVSVGGGYSLVQGPIGDISVEEKNLFGTGQSAKIKLVGSFINLQAEASFTEPHLLGSNVAGGFDLFYKDYDATTQSSYMSQKIGGDIRVAYPITDTVTGSVNYTFTRNTIYNVGADASAAIKEAVPGYPAATQATYYTSSIGYSLAYDTRNSKRLPTSGTYFMLTQDFAGLGGDVRFVKSSIDLRGYYPVSTDVTLVGRTTAGNIMGWGGQDVRLLDMFYVGGETVRGFAPGGIGPRDTLSANQDALGGTSYIATTAEARFGLPLVPDAFGLRGAVFADAGSLFGTSAAASKLPGLQGANAAMRASAGAGLIWDSPIGPLRADYAFPLVKQPFDKTQPWSFGLAAF